MPTRKKWGEAPPKPRVVLRPGSRTKEPLTQKQQELLIAQAMQMGDFEYKTVLILLETGMHISVLSDKKANLRVWEDKFLQWTRPKNGEPISMPIPKRLRPWIANYLNSSRPPYRTWYNRLLKELGKRTGIVGLSPLTLRHTFAVNRLNQGYTLGDLQGLMGTRSLRSLAHYTRYSKAYMESRYEGKEW